MSGPTIPVLDGEERGTPVRCTRLGVVGYLNAEPLVWGLEADPAFELRRDTPSRVAEDLHAGRVELGLIPSVEYGRGEYVVVPDVAVGSDGEVRSVALFLPGPLDGVRRVALDTSSRTSVALLQVLLAERLARRVEYVPMAPDLDAMLRSADAALLIGDAALDAPGELARLDLGVAWRELTGLPFVFAFWAGPATAVSRGVVDGLQAAAARGRAELSAVARAAAPERSGAEAYLRENIVFDLGESQRRGLSEFYRRAAALGLLPRVPELRFHGDS